MPHHHRSLSRNIRGKRGATLALVVACVLGIVTVIAFGLLAFGRFIGSHERQIAANDAAALAAAQAFTRLTVDDPNFGLIALSGRPATGPGTTAGDNFYTPVLSINTLMATNRLDAIIADQLNDNTLRACVSQDYTKVLAAKDRLVAEMARCTAPGAYGQDADGNKVSPVQEALDAYQSNSAHLSLTEQKASLVPNSLHLTLGYAAQPTTNVPIPQPDQFASINANCQENGFYKAYIDAVYNGKDFVFAATVDNAALLDTTKFLPSRDPTLPWAIPTIVKCESDQQFPAVYGKGVHVVHAISCAQPGTMENIIGAPQYLCLSFPHGIVPEIHSMIDVFNNYNIDKSPSDVVQSPAGGDNPPQPLNTKVLGALQTQHPPFGQCLRVTFFDWLRCNGAAVDIKSLSDCMQSAILPQSSGFAALYSVDKSGTVHLDETAINPTPLLPISDNQWFATTGVGFNSMNGNMYDITIKDFVYQLGRAQGGIHAGQPLPMQFDKNASPWQAFNGIAESPSMMGKYPIGPNGGATRPTVNAPSIATEIRFKLR